MRKLTHIAIPIFASLTAVDVRADVIQISNSDDSFLLYSNSINGLFNSTSPFFTTADLASVHTTLNNWGIDTDGKITILPVNTTMGLTFLTLIDEELGLGDNGVDGVLGLTSTAPNSLSMFINDSNQDDWSLIQPPFGSQTMGSTFVWGSVGSGDGFAWAGLSIGDAVSYSFVDLDGDGGAIGSEAFQFVSWTESGWDVVSTNGFKTDGTSVFTGMVIPAPGAALLLIVFSVGRRRRRC